jgi:hypothetical protein
MKAQLKIMALRLFAITGIASVMAFIGSVGLIAARYEDLGSGLLLSTQPGRDSLSLAFSFMPLSCVTWLILTPLLNRGKLWVVIPAAFLAPFLGSALLAFSVFIGGGVKMGGPFAIALGVVYGGWVTFLAWTFIINAAKVMVPTGLVTGALIWFALNKLLPANSAKAR